MNKLVSASKKFIKILKFSKFIKISFTPSLTYYTHFCELGRRVNT